MVQMTDVVIITRGNVTVTFDDINKWDMTEKGNHKTYKSKVKDHIKDIMR